ncbi:hypothetical protein [Breoghania sp.]|uniref:hypothetical protein n=1 Tax=Breoghania sp. TaxID=2065378 RepID=UPI00260DE793|nr:hypothetical protein [Breoghania sp.]MDJ0933103.1 hypothetical protein [Breoghania sp.]
MWDRVDSEARELMKGKVELTAASAEQLDFLRSKLDPLIEKKLADISSAIGIDAKAAYEEMVADAQSGGAATQ